MQFTYYNNTDSCIGVFVYADPSDDIGEYKGYIAPEAMLSFDVKVPKGHGIFIKMTAKDVIVVGTSELQTAPNDKAALDEITPTYYQEQYGGEP